MDQKKFTFLSPKETLFRLFMITCSALIIALNLKSFVQAGDLFPGGITGTTRLLQRIASQYFDLSIPFGPLNLLLNAIPAVIAFRYIGKRFTFYSCLCIILLSIFADLVPALPITEDLLLISVFGGLINGFAISLCLMARVSGGGMDFISIALSQRKNIDAWNYILGFNVVMLTIAGLLFGWERALYSIIFQFASTQVVRLMDPDNKRVTLLIVTEKELADAVCNQILQIHHTATLLNGTGLYNGSERVMIYTVVRLAESRSLSKRVHEADPNAFINILPTQRIQGNFYRPPKD